VTGAVPEQDCSAAVQLLRSGEMARIQTFPDDVEVLGGISNVQKQLGNAVPSALAEILGKEIKAQFFDDKVTTGLVLTPKKKKRTKEIGFNEGIPNEYLELVTSS
jgi:DNA (cytosine-5)-methyltransferase 1